jgi:hypothetical protein
MMQRPLFDFVEQIRAAQKYFDVSRLELKRQLLVEGKCDVTGEHDVIDEANHSVTTELRLNIAARDDHPESWTVALKLHGVRIDGIDYEPRFRTIDGEIAHGWHRHQWDPDEEKAERGKVPIANFEGVEDREQFLIRALSVLRVKLNAVDHGQDTLL